MSNPGAAGGTRWQSCSESGPSRLNSSTFDDKLFAENADLSINGNNLSNQSQQAIPIDLPEGFIASPMWVGIGTRLQVRKLAAGTDQQAFVESKYECIRESIATWQRDIDEEPIIFEGINTQHVSLKGSIYSLYQEALYSCVTDKLSYDIISLTGLNDRVKRATNKYIRNENRIVSSNLNQSEPKNVPSPGNVNEGVSDLGNVISDCSPIVAGSIVILKPLLVWETQLIQET